MPEPHEQPGHVCGGGGSCVEIIFRTDGDVGIRRIVYGQMTRAMNVTRPEWDALATAIKEGRFDD